MCARAYHFGHCMCPDFLRWFHVLIYNNFRITWKSLTRTLNYNTKKWMQNHRGMCLSCHTLQVQEQNSFRSYLVIRFTLTFFLENWISIYYIYNMHTYIGVIWLLLQRCWCFKSNRFLPISDLLAPFEHTIVSANVPIAAVYCFFL